VHSRRPRSHYLERVFVAPQIGSEASLVAHAGGEFSLHQHLLERVKDLRAHPQRFGEGFGADGNDHVLLEIHRVGGVRTTVQDVHQGHRHRARQRAAQVPVQGESTVDGGGTSDGHRDTEDGVRPQLSLVWRPIEVDHRPVDLHLVDCVHTEQRRSNLVGDVLHGLHGSLSAVARRIAVTELQRLVLPGGRSARHGGSPRCPAVERDVDFDGGIAATVEDLARVDV
jgi:hypothetical protein